MKVKSSAKLAARKSTEKNLNQKIQEAKHFFQLPFSDKQLSIRIDDSLITDDIEEEYNVDDRSVPIEVSVSGEHAYCQVRQQPGCCANLILYDFSHSSDKAVRVLFLTAIRLAEQLTFTNVQFTHYPTHETVEVAKELGFKISDIYISNRTTNKLVDCRLTI